GPDYQFGLGRRVGRRLCRLAEAWRLGFRFALPRLPIAWCFVGRRRLSGHSLRWTGRSGASRSANRRILFGIFFWRLGWSLRRRDIWRDIGRLLPGAQRIGTQIALDLLGAGGQTTLVDTEQR